MKTRKAPTPRPIRTLGLEPLESRVVLDGNVNAFLSGGTLHINSGSANNEITITQNAAQSFTISSRDGTTTINGQSSDQTFNGVRKDLDINLGGGADVVEMDGSSFGAATVSNRLNINMGSGDDQVLLNHIHALGLHINTGSGNDLLNVGNDGAEDGMIIVKEAVIVMGSGRDDARIFNSDFRRFVNLIMAGNNDTVTMEDVTARRRSVIDGGSGFDTAHRLNVGSKVRFKNFEQFDHNVTSPAPVAPVAVNDTATVARGGSTTINVATNDTAANGQTLDLTSIAITQQPTSGTVTVNSNGTVTYTNTSTSTATTDTFKYTIDDDAGTTSNAATVTITITAAAPLTAANDTASIIEDSSTNPINGNVLTNDTGGTGPKTVSLVNGLAANVGANVPGQHGTFHINADGTFTYTLDNADANVNNLTNGQTLTDSMSYTASAGTETSTATLNVTITGHTDTAFNAVNDTATIAEDATPNTISGSSVVTNDTNAAGAVTVTNVNGVAANVGADVPGQHGTFHINPDGSFTYALNNGDATVNALTTGQTLTDSMPYTASDGTTSSSARLTITIQGHTDTAFNAVDDAFSITEDATPNTITGVNVLTNDTNAAGATTVTAVNGVQGNVGTNVPGQFGTFNIGLNGALTYTLDNTNTTVNGLNTGETRIDIMPYTASDGTTSSTANVRITIQGHTD